MQYVCKQTVFSRINISNFHVLLTIYGSDCSPSNGFFFVSGQNKLFMMETS